jgi:hypothetical protein
VNTGLLSLEVPGSILFKAVGHTPPEILSRNSVPADIIKLTGKQPGGVGFAEFKSVFWTHDGGTEPSHQPPALELCHGSMTCSFTWVRRNCIFNSSYGFINFSKGYFNLFKSSVKYDRSFPFQWFPLQVSFVIDCVSVYGESLLIVKDRSRWQK